MHNKEQAKKLGPLVSNPAAWNSLEEYLQDLKALTFRGLVTAQSESELRQMQGKAALLETLLKLKDNYDSYLREK